MAAPDGLTAEFHVVEQLRQAASNGRRADILLRLPDEIMTRYCEQLREVCAAAWFVDGCRFIAVRVAMHCAVRSRDGRVPSEAAIRFHLARLRLVSIAAGTAVSSATS